MLQLYGRIYEGWSMVSTRPQVRARDEVRFRHFAGAVVLRLSSELFTNMADLPLPGGSHLVDFIAGREPTPSRADGDAREAEATFIHGAFLQACGVVLLPSGSPRVARDTQTLVARILADRLSRAFAVVNTSLTSTHKHFHRRFDDDVAHAAWYAAVEQTSMQGSLVVDILAAMRNEDLLMEAGVSVVDPHAPWLLNEVDSLRAMDMAVTYSRKLIADFIVFQRLHSEDFLGAFLCCPARQVMNSTVG